MKKLILLFLVFSVASASSGCWNKREINELGTVAAIGVDIIEDELIEVTVQVVVPRYLGRQSTENNAVVIWSETGKTMFEALTKINTISAKKIYIGHIRLIVFGEKLATVGIQNIIDFLERETEFRRQSIAVVSTGMSAKELLHVKSIYELIPAVHIVETINNSALVGFTRRFTLIDVFEEFNSLGNQLVLGVANNTSKESPQVVRDIVIEGAAVFHEDRLLGFLDVLQTRGFLWVVDEIKGGILVVPPQGEKEELISMEIIRAESKMDVELKDGEILLKVTIKEEGNIGGQQNVRDHTNPTGILHLNQEKEQVIRDEVNQVFHIAQKEFEVDFFGFGELVHKKHPHLWEQIKDDWNDVFTNLSVEINIETKVLRSGQILKPSQSN